MSKQENTVADRFFAAVAPRSTSYELPGVGTVDLVELREAEVSEIRRQIESEKDLNRRSKLFGLGLIVRSVHQEGKRLFGDADIERFGEAGNSAVEKLAAAVLSINGYGSQESETAGN
jgi:hypothetical protein